MKTTMHRRLLCCISAIVLLSALFTSQANAFSSDTVPLKPYKIYDFSGALLYEGGPGRWVTNLFDGFSSHDPKGNNKSYLDNAGSATGMIPYRGTWVKEGKDASGNLYRGKRGWLMMFDMTGDKDMFRLAKFNITDIYGLQRGGDYQDTMYFYNGDKIFEAPVEKRPMMLARPDSLMQPFAKLVAGAAINWRPEWCSVNGLKDSMRYILVRIYPKSRGNYNSWPDFSELVIYGSKRFADGTISRRPASYTGPLPAMKPLKQVVGTCNAGVFDEQLNYEGLVRAYQTISLYDDEASANLDYPNNKYNFNHYNFGTDLFEYHNTWFPASRGAMYWTSIRAGSKRLETQLRQLENNPKISAERIMNVTRPYMEPEDPWSYQADGDFFRHFAKIWGSNTSTSDLSTYRFYNTGLIPGPPVGKNKYELVENGNEDETNQNASILAYVVRSLVDYDGWENRIPNCGIKNGDSNFKLIYAGTVFLDSNRVSCSIFLSRLLRSDRKVVWDYFNAHHYSRTYNHLDHSPTYEEAVGVKGESPEKDRLYERLVAAKRHLYNELNGDTTKGFLLTEYGYDNWSTPSKSVADLSFGAPWYAAWTVSGTPVIPGYDSVQSKGLMMVRAESIIAASGIAGYNEFTIMNVGYRGDNNYPGLFATCGRGGGGVQLPVKFANYWTRASLWNMLKEYKVDSIIAMKGDQEYVLRWRHISKPDSVCYQVWKGSYNGSTIAQVSVPVGYTQGNALKKTVSFTSASPLHAGEQAVNNNLMTVTAKEEPAFYFLLEALAPNQPPVAKAGDDQVIALPVNSTTLTSAGSSDKDGVIVSYKWTKSAGPATGTIETADKPTTRISGLTAGVYVFELTVTDDRGAVAKDQVTVTVISANQAPVANAGTDNEVLSGTTFKLDGTGSKDADGSVTKYHWVQVSGGSTATFDANAATPSVIIYAAGDYLFELTVTDNQGATSKDQVRIVVKPQPVVIANAGADTVLSFPVSKAVLDGNGSVGAVGSAIQWRQIAGPSSVQIMQRNMLRTEVINLVLGDYAFELTVTGAHNVTDKDTVMLVVKNTEKQAYYAVYPNPVRDDLVILIDNEKSGKLKVRLYETHGRVVVNKVFSKETTEFRETIHVAHLVPGMYILELTLPGATKPLFIQVIKQP